MYTEKFKGFISMPSKTFDKYKKESSDMAFKYLIVFSVIMAIIAAVVAGIVFAVAGAAASMFLPPTIPLGMLGAFSGLFTVTVFFAVLIGTVVGMVIWSLWLHLWIYVLGGKKGIDQTFKAVFYGHTPMYVLFWIPFVNLIVMLWAFVLQGIGIKKLHGLTGGKAAAAIIVALIIPILIIAAIVGPALMYAQTMNPMIY